MRAPDWDMTLLGEHRARLLTSSGQDTFARMVEIAEELRDYDCKPNRQGEVRDFRYFDPATDDFPYSFIVNRHDLLFYVRRSGFKRVPGGLAALRARFDSVKENPSGEWTLRIATVEDADALGAFLFDVPDQFALRRRAEDAAENGIQQRTDIGPTEKARLVNARLGQGVYRSNLEELERACRVTGMPDRRLLRASHIKPWCECDDREKLDGFNGLLLSPHIDHLFDRGYISFSDGGELLLSKAVDPAALTRWGLTLPMNVGTFCTEQCVYFAYHRKYVFECM